MARRLHPVVAGCGMLVATMLPHPQEAAARERMQECAIPVQSLSGELVRSQPLSLEMLNLPSGPGPSGAAPGVTVRGLAASPLSGSARPVLDGVPLGMVERIEVLTGPDGRIPCRTVPDVQWKPRGAFDGGTLTLPSNGFGVLYGKDAASGALNLRYKFGLRDGAVLSERDWALQAISPFSLLCRSDEGAPQSLTSGDRFSYDVPGDESGLKFVIRQPFVLDPSWYRLPDGGYAVSSASGGNAKETWRGLNELALGGRIRNLEIDPCWKFLPEGAPAARGCTPGPRSFPEKAVRYSGGFGGTLSDPFTRSPLGNSWVRWGPLSPTPFFDPGERPGDERPPTYTMTGPGGMYRASLDGLAGPFEIDVARGCGSHATVAIADGPSGPSVAGLTTGLATRPAQGGMSTAGDPGGGTRAPGSTATPQPPAAPVQSTPRKPGPDELVCGPDVTDHVLDALRLLQETYNSWDYWTRAGKCLVLYNPLKFQAAWDMQLFTPSDGEDYMTHKFFQRAAPDYCAVPPHPCGPTVKFMGYCIHAQVVNYVQWGLMNELCDNQAFGIAANAARSGMNVNYTGQDAMGALGEAFGAISGTIDFRKGVMKRILDQHVRGDQTDWYAMQGTNCALTCDEVATGAKRWLDGQAWGFQWGDVVRTTRDERLERELKELEERKRREGRQ